MYVRHTGQVPGSTANLVVQISRTRACPHGTRTKPLRGVNTLADPRGSCHAPPRHVGKRPECTKSRHFQTQIENFSGEGQCQLVFLCINHNVVSNTLVLSPRAICIHTTASFPTSNGFLRLKHFKQSMEE